MGKNIFKLNAGLIWKSMVRKVDIKLRNKALLFVAFYEFPNSPGQILTNIENLRYYCSL